MEVFKGPPVSRYAARHLLYKTGFSTVHVGRDRITQREVAIKRTNDDKIARKELHTMQRLRDAGVPNIVPVVEDRLLGDECVTGRTVCDLLGPNRNLVMWLCDTVSVHTLGRTDADISGFFLPVVTTLAQMHDIGVVHADVKLENVLLNGNDPVLIDFGLSYWMEEDGDVKKIRGSPFYIAPELVRSRNLGPWSDAYSLGVTLYSVAHGGKHPIPKMNEYIRARSLHKSAWSIATENAYEDKNWENDDAPRTRDLVNGLLAARPLDRMTLADALTHELFDEKI